MKFLHIIMLCCSSALCLKASEVLEVSSHVGGEVSIHCSASWSTDKSSEHNHMYFCKGACSRENILIHTERKRRAVTRRGKYTLEVNRGHGYFNVTIKRLKRADAGKYCCGVEKSFNVLYQDVSLEVQNATLVPAGSPPSTTTLQTEAEALLQGSTEPSPAALTSPATEKTNQRSAISLTATLVPAGSPPSTTTLQTEAEALLQGSTEPSPAALTSPATEKTNQRSAISLTDTTVVIIVSVSLALLVCAVIPLIFYAHWRANAGQNSQEENKAEADHDEENKGVACAQTAVRLQSLESDADPESGAQDLSQYAGIYQALDPKTLN